MSGRRHHIIPQFLLRQFFEEKASHIWVYPKGRKPYGTSSNNVFVERDFYGPPESNKADEILTNAEGYLSRVLVDLVSCPVGVVEDSDACSELVIHLMGRTKHLRLTFGDLLSKFTEGCIALFENESFAKKLIIADLSKNPQILRKAGMPGGLLDAVLVPETLSELVDMFFKEQGYAVQSMIKELKERMVASFPKLMAEKHNESLAKLGIKNDEKKKLLGSHYWRIVHCGDVPLLLSVSVCLFEYESTRGFVAFDSHGPDYDAVYMPLNHSRLLIGSQDRSYKIIRTELYNKEAARASREVFVASEESDYFKSLHSIIGENFSPVSDEELVDELVKTAERQLLIP